MIVKSKLNIFLTNFYVFNPIKLYNLYKNLRPVNNNEAEKFYLFFDCLVVAVELGKSYEVVVSFSGICDSGTEQLFSSFGVLTSERVITNLAHDEVLIICCRSL